jgi:predicted O-methyltransferase YrrM
VKPLFTGAFEAFSDFDREALKTQVRSIAARRVLEVGSWLGNGSTRTLLAEGVFVYAVDHWLGNRNVPRHREIAAEFDVFATFQRNTAQWADRVKPMVMSSADAAAIVCDGVFDLVFLDADHSYDETRRDIALWSPKVRPGGILCGHDCEGRPDDYGRERLAANRDQDAIAAERFPQIHPGCILAVDEAFNGGATLWAEDPLTLPDGRRGHSTIWYVKVG